jgi:TonB family protein
MKSLAFRFRGALTCAFACASDARTNAQANGQVEATPDWIRLKPPGELFSVWMPGAHTPVAEQVAMEALKVEGQRYQLRQEKAVYTVWSLKPVDTPASVINDEDEYLDRAAEVAWHLLVKPQGGKLKKLLSGVPKNNLTYDGEMPLNGYDGRSYRLKLDEQLGETRIYVVGAQMYIVATAGEPQEADKVSGFIKSFRLRPPEPGVGLGRGGGMFSERAFTAREVMQHAVVRSKRQPEYTEWARRFGVNGKIRVRAVLAASGEVTEITPLSRLPHGLTKKAIEAAQKIKFTPAVKDGKLVSQYVTIDYTFSLN